MGEVLAVIQNAARYEDVIQLQKTLKTLNTSNLVIALSDSLLFPAQAEIITDERRLIERLFYKLNSNVLTKNMFNTSAL